MVYFPCKRLIARILLLGQFLTSCGNPCYLRIGKIGSWHTSSRALSASSTLCKVNHASPSIGEFSALSSTQEDPLLETDSAAHLASGTTPSSEIAPFSYTFIKSPGYRIVLSPDGDRYQAMVYDNRFPGLSRSYVAAVRFEKGCRLEDFVTKSPSYQSYHIHLLSMNKNSPIVYIGSLGLKSGGCNCNRPIWHCVFCGDPCPEDNCEPCCAHMSQHGNCRLIAQQQLQQEQKNRNKFRRQQEEIAALTSKRKVLEENLMQEEASLKAYSQRKRAERAARSLAFVEELASKKQAIHHQSFLDETKVLYNKFISNLELEVTLKKSVEQETTALSSTSQSVENEPVNYFV
ncbi:hypothetical protein [Cardinium endosymbiont of Nabis limbatus]|uniref:hypothetical protein n=1 Tax=Cardinium endosymbiont of Nabis limbatus TaxID=3066217 RepID=UPI003AF3EC1D